MITINRGSFNELVVTLQEKVTIENPNYLLQVFSNDNHTEKVIRMTGDSSSNIVRWNKLPLKEVELVDEDLENGLVYLPEGSYDYKFFQTSATTGTTIVGLLVVETGKLLCNGTGTTITTYPSENGIITFE